MPASNETPSAEPNATPKHPSPQASHLSPVPNRLQLTYDILMIIVIGLDLLLIGIDAILMSNFSTHVAQWLTVSEALNWYQDTLHHPLGTAGGFFTLFLIVELLLRWAMAIKNRAYYRWFFFPFVHWYEVLGCLPQLRALRLLRAVVIGRRLYQLGYQVLPPSWLSRIKFYTDLLLEELSDRVILTTIQNFRQELSNPEAHKSFIESTILRNRDDIEAVLLSLLRTELVPKLQQLTHASGGGRILADEVGYAIEEGLANTPELHRYLRAIPLAGGLIESQLQHVGHNIGENVVYALNQRLLDPALLDALMVAIARGVAQINTDNTALETLISRIIDDSLTEIAAQVKVQQWKQADKPSG